MLEPSRTRTTFFILALVLIGALTTFGLLYEEPAPSSTASRAALVAPVSEPVPILIEDAAPATRAVAPPSAPSEAPPEAPIDPLAQSAAPLIAPPQSPPEFILQTPQPPSEPWVHSMRMKREAAKRSVEDEIEVPGRTAAEAAELRRRRKLARIEEENAPAASTPSPEPAPNYPPEMLQGSLIVKLGKGRGQAGGEAEFTVELVLTKHPGPRALSIVVATDPHLVPIAAKPAPGKEDSDGTIGLSIITRGRLRLTLLNGPEFLESGILATLRFQVEEGMPERSYLSIVDVTDPEGSPIVASGLGQEMLVQ